MKRNKAEEHIKTYISGLMRSIAILQKDRVIPHTLAIQLLRSKVDKALYECRKNSDYSSIIDSLGINDIE